MESIRKLSDLNFQWTKTLYQNNLNNTAFFFAFFTGYRYLTIIPLTLMGSKSIAHEAEGRMHYCLSKIQPVCQKYWNKTTLGRKTRFSCNCFGFQSRYFSLLVGYNI